MLLSGAVVLAIASASLTAARTPQLDPQLQHHLLHSNSRPQIGLWRALHRQAQEEAALRDLSTQQVFDTSDKKGKYGPYCFEQKSSHFDPAQNGTFCQRYWIDASHYEPGGPVFVLDGGETYAEIRIPFLETGILQILSNETSGIGIILEHRYYGGSLPVKDLSTDNLRWLNNAEALEDSANFIANFQPPKHVLDVKKGALHPEHTPWFYYGGSYAGARSAHMRTQYPDLVWGAIASSAVTHAAIEMPEYMQVIAKYGPTDCIDSIQTAIAAIDVILALPEPAPSTLKGLFGLQELKDNQDFAAVLESPLGYWQGQNWDASISTNGFNEFCAAMTAGGADSQIGFVKVPASVLNYASYIKKEVTSLCPVDDIGECFGTHNTSQFASDDLEEVWRLWFFQTCTQWGYYNVPPAEGPRLISSFMDVEYSLKHCRAAYPPGEYFKLPELPDVEEVNRRGDFAISMDRLAIIDGEWDPWRPMTPQADVAPRRTSTVKRPVHMVPEGIHHYDENGLWDHTREPAQVRDVHALEVNFISEWLAEWREEKQK